MGPLALGGRLIRPVTRGVELAAAILGAYLEQSTADRRMRKGKMSTREFLTGEDPSRGHSLAVKARGARLGIVRAFWTGRAGAHGVFPR